MDWIYRALSSDYAAPETNQVPIIANTPHQQGSPTPRPAPVAAPANTPATGHKGWFADLFKNHLSPGPQAGRQDLVVPSRGVDGNGDTQKGSVHKQIKSMVLGGLAGWLLGILVSSFKRVLGALARRWMIHGLLALGIFGYLGSQWIGRGSHRESARPVTASQGGGQAPTVPGQSAQANRDAQLGLVSNPPKVMGIPGIDFTADSPALEASFVVQFLHTAFNPNPDDMIGWIDNLRRMMKQPDYVSFNKDFYPDKKFGDIVDYRMTQTFQLTQPVTCFSRAKTSKDTEDYLAYGVLTTKGGPKAPDQATVAQPVTFRLDVYLTDDTKFWVTKISLLPARLSPGPQAGGQGLVVPSQGADGNGGTTGGSAGLSPGPYPPIGNKPMGEPGSSRIEAPSEGKAPKGDPGQAASKPATTILPTRWGR